MNIGGYDKNSFYDKNGVSYLTYFLQRTGHISTHFQQEDKIPNYDGRFEVCKDDDEGKKVIPVCNFFTQIKTLNKKYTYSHENKYSCDTKILNAVLSQITLDPVILFLVDISGSHVFWKYLSEEYCLDNLQYKSLKNGLHEKEVGHAEGKDNEKNALSQKKKTFTVHFSKADEITDVEKWIEIILCKREEHIENLNKSTSVTLWGKNSANSYIAPSIQLASDNLNSIMEHELKFIRNKMFANTWKFGIAYSDEENIKKIGFYKIIRGENKSIIKSYEDDIDIGYSIFAPKMDLAVGVYNYAKHLVDLFFRNNMYYPDMFPTDLLSELIFREIDGAVFNKNNPVALSGCGIQESKQLHSGDKVIYCLQEREINWKRYDELKKDGLTTCLSDACFEEVRHRGLDTVCRIWEKVLYGILGEEREEEIDDSMIINEGWKHERKVITVRDVENDRDLDEIKKINRNRFLRGVDRFIDESCERLNDEFTRTIDREKIKAEIKGLDRIEPFYDFSWYKLWRLTFQELALRNIRPKDSHEKDMLISIQYISSI